MDEMADADGDTSRFIEGDTAALRSARCPARRGGDGQHTPRATRPRAPR